MDSTSARKSTLWGNLFSALLSCFAALGPIIGLHIWYFFIFPNVFFLLPSPLGLDMPIDIAMLLEGLLPPALLCILIAFAANLIIPVATDEWKAMLYAIPG